MLPQTRFGTSTKTQGKQVIYFFGGKLHMKTFIYEFQPNYLEIHRLIIFIKHKYLLFLLNLFQTFLKR